MLIGYQQVQGYAYRQYPQYDCDDDQEPVESSKHHRSWGPEQTACSGAPGLYT